MAWAAVLAAPEATELGCLDGIAWHRELERCRLDRTAAGKVGVRRRICRPHLRIFLSMDSSWRGIGGTNWLVYVSRGMSALCRT